MALIDVKQLTKTIAGLIKALTPRNRDIVSRRFGLKNGTRETLEAIGKSYGITRERVRQIEEFSLTQLTKSAPESRELTKALAAAKDLLGREGGVVLERSLFKLVSGTDKETVGNASLSFALSLDRELVRTSENDRFSAFWALDKRTRDAFVDRVASLAGALRSRDAVTDQAGLVSLAQSSGVTGADGAKFGDRHLSSLLEVSKELGRNIFGELGLSNWTQIRPKGVRDKAYLVIKKSGKPQHFSDIARLINQAKFDSKKTNVQTVHNELIKDGRFVLVGRGMYALAEWGYKSGTVRDVLTDILKTHSKPLSRADLIAKVKDVRLVKENTILLNLQDSSAFVRDASGNYQLRRK